MNPREQKFEQIIKKNRDRLFRICRAYLADPDDAKDLYQEILLRIWTNLDKFRGDAQLSTWLYRIAVNTALLYQRRQQRQPGPLPDHELLLPDNSHETTEKLQHEIMLQRLHFCIAQLQKQDRLIISLVLEEVSYKEIADVLGLTVSNVGVKINRIKQKLTTLMEEAARAQSAENIPQP